MFERQELVECEAERVGARRFRPLDFVFDDLLAVLADELGGLDEALVSVLLQEVAVVLVPRDEPIPRRHIDFGKQHWIVPYRYIDVIANFAVYVFGKLLQREQRVTVQVRPVEQ